MSAPFDLAAYFERIGFAGPAAADLPTLRAIHALQPVAIPFENLDPLLGRPVRLDPATLQAKLVGARRGGYCFELTGLFRAALEALGFAVTPLVARVRWMAPPDQPPGPRTHMLLRVDLDDGPYLADVGFGGYLLGAPVRLEPDIEQPVPAGLVRLVVSGQAWTLQGRLPAGWQDCYRFTLEPAADADYVMGNWFTATHPESLFTTNLLAQRLTSDGRVGLLNTKFTRRGADGTAEERTLTSADALAEALRTDLQITLPADPAQIWARLPKP